MGPSKEVYIAQTSLLTKVFGYHTQPDSVIFTTLVHSFRSSFTTFNESIQEKVIPEEFPFRFKNYFHKLLSDINRYLNQKGSLVNPSREELCLLWLIGRHLLSLQSHYLKNARGSGECRCIHCRFLNYKQISDEVEDSVRLKPLNVAINQPPHTVTNTNSIRSRQLISNQWLSKERERVKSYYKLYSTQVKYLIESKVSKDLLKTVVRDLRYCCEQSTGDWIDCLKKFRKLFSLLVREGQTDSTVTIMHK